MNEALFWRYYRLSKIIAHRDVPFYDHRWQLIDYTPKAYTHIVQAQDKALQQLRASRQQDLGLEMQNDLAEIRIRAERRAGELLIEMKDQGVRQAQGRPEKRYTDDTIKLDEIGISKVQSSHWQQIAEIPEDDFESHDSMGASR